MTAAIISLIIALISYFGSKKAGASDGQAAAIAAGAGLGSYYVATNTEWGKGVIDNIGSWVGLKDAEGAPVLDSNGDPVKAPAGAEVVYDENGQPALDPSGNVIWKLVDSAGNVLTSWGAAGTAGVLATGSLLSKDEKNPLLWIGGGVLLFLAVSN